jgi:hypothetical protein
LSHSIKAGTVMATLHQAWTGERCPHEDRCACRQGSWCPQSKLSNNEHDHPMLHLAGCSFAYKRCCCQILEELENLADEYLKEAGVTNPPVPFDVIGLFDTQRRIEIRYLPLKRYYGCTWSIDRQWVVHINEDLRSEVRRFTAFHEGFHVILGSSGLAFKDNRDGHEVVSERLADYFAASILMPREMVYRHWPETRSLSKIAGIFSVPEAEMKDWLVRLRILPD